MTNRTLPPLTASDADDLAIEIITALLSQPNKVGPVAVERVNRLMRDTPTVEWDTWILVGNGATPCAFWLSDREAIHLLLEAHEVLVPVAAMAESIISARAGYPTDELDDDDIDWDRVGVALDRAVGVLIGVLMAVVLIGTTVMFARQAGATPAPSCSLHVLEVDDDGITWGYTPDDGVVRGVHLPGGGWVALQIGGRTRTPNVPEIAYPSRGDRIVVADLIRQCTAAPVTTTSTIAPPTTTTSTAPSTTTTAPAPTTTTPEPTTTAPAPTTTAPKARPAVACPAGTVIAFTHHGPADDNGVWTFRFTIGSQPGSVRATDRTWIATWPVPDGGLTIEVDDDITVACTDFPPATTVPVPPTTDVSAVTPAPLPPATWTVVPPTTTTADVLAPVTAPPSAVTGGELPRTGPTRTSVVLTLAAMLGALGFGFWIVGPLYARLRR